MDGLESEFRGMLRVERLNVDDPVGRHVYERLGTSGVPTIVLYDPSGREVYRAERKVPRMYEVRAAIEAMGASPCIDAIRL